MTSWCGREFDKAFWLYRLQQLDKVSAALDWNDFVVIAMNDEYWRYCGSVLQSAKGKQAIITTKVVRENTVLGHGHDERESRD